MSDYFQLCGFAIVLSGFLNLVVAGMVFLHMAEQGRVKRLGFKNSAWFLAVLIGGVFGFGLYLYWFQKESNADPQKP